MMRAMVPATPGSARPPRAGFFITLVASVLAMSVGWFMAEVITRWLMPPLGFGSRSQSGAPLIEERPEDLGVSLSGGIRLRPNAVVKTEPRPPLWTSGEIRTNEFGFRGPPIGAKGPEETRILVVGDSIVHGAETPEEALFTTVMQRHLPAPPGQLVRVLNAGVPGADAHSEAALILREGLAAQPDVIVLAVYLNDRSGLPFFKPLTGIWAHSAVLVTMHDAVTQWMLVDHINSATEELLQRKLPPVRWTMDGQWISSHQEFERLKQSAVLDWGGAWREDTWPILRASYQLIKEAAAERGIRFALVLFPVWFQVRAQWKDDHPQQQFSRMATELGVPHLDLLPLLAASQSTSAEPLFFDHCHLSPAGHAVAGQLMASWLQDLGWVPGTGNQTDPAEAPK